MIYKVKAIDQLFFRSSAPFEGSQLFPSQFPPFPTTYSGIFRPMAENPKRMRISYNGIILNHGKDKIDFCFPQPLDTVLLKESPKNPEKDHSSSEDVDVDSKEEQFVLETMEVISTPHSNLKIPACLTLKKPERKKKSEATIYLTKKELEKYLGDGKDVNDNTKAVTGFPLEKYLSTERKVGIGTDFEMGRTVDGMLYQIEMVRPKDGLQLAVKTVETDGKDLVTQKATVKLGGEGKVVHIQPLQDDLNVETPDIYLTGNEQKYFKLYLATPAIFGNGWLPQWICDKTYEGCFKHRKKWIKVKLMAATVGRFIPVGGFGYETSAETKIKSYHPREMRYAVPAGSVYYFKVLSSSLDGLVEKTEIDDLDERSEKGGLIKNLFHQRCISDYREILGFQDENGLYDYSEEKDCGKREWCNRFRYCDRGFGYALVGAVSEKQIKELNNHV